MGEITISIPEELEEDIRKLSKINLSLAIARMIKTELERLAKLKSIISKSKLTEEDVKELSDKTNKELSDKTNKALSKRFNKSIKE